MNCTPGVVDYFGAEFYGRYSVVNESLKNGAPIRWMSSQILGWQTRIYILYTSTYPGALDTHTWAKPLKVPPSDILFGFAYWHKLSTLRQEWSTYDMIGVVTAEQCTPASITHMSKILTDDTLLKHGYHQFKLGETTRKYSELFIKLFKKNCKPPLLPYTAQSTYNAWICSADRMTRFIDWFSTHLVPFINAKPLGFEDMVKVSDSMKVNGEAAPYTLITTLMVEKLINGYFATDPIDEKMSKYYTNDYDRESSRIAQHEHLKLKFVKSVETTPKHVPKNVKPEPVSEKPDPEPAPTVLELLQEEYRSTRAATEQLEAEELVARNLLADEMRKKAIIESNLVATLQKTMILSSNVTGDDINREYIDTETGDIRQQVEKEISRERLQAEENAQQCRKVIDEELAEMRRKTEADMIASVRTAELESIKQIQQITNTSVTAVREDTERKIAAAKATLAREKQALERAKFMQIDLEKKRTDAIQEAEETVQRMRIIEKETRKYKLLLEQATGTRQRYEAEKAMLIKQVEVELKFVRSSMEQMETIQREKEQRIKATREEVETNMKQALLKSELAAVELRRKTELDVIAERQQREAALRDEIREKENAYLANKHREDTVLEATIKSRRAEYLQQKKRDDERILDELKAKELLYSRERDHKLELFAIEKRQNDEEYTKRSKEALEILQKEHDIRVANAASAHAEEIATLEKALAEIIAANKSEIEELYTRQRKENAAYLADKEATLVTLTEEHERALAISTEKMCKINEECYALKYTLEQMRAKKEATEAQMSHILTELNTTTLTGTRLEESIFSMRMQCVDTTETIERLTHETQLIKPKLEQLNATRLLAQKDHEIYQLRIKEQTALTEAATAELAKIEIQHAETHAAKLRIEQQLRNKQGELHTNTLALTTAEKTIEDIKINTAALVKSRIAADQSIRALNEQLKQSKELCEDSESRRKDINEALTKVLATLRETEQTLAESEHTLAEQRQEVQRAESLLEANTRAYDEAKANYTTLVERNTETELEIQKFSDTCSSLDQAYTEMVTTRDTMYARQTELYRRNITENKLLNANRAELAKLEVLFAEKHAAKLRIEQQLSDKQGELQANTLALTTAEKMIEDIKINTAALVNSRIAAEQSICALNEQLKQSKEQYEDNESRHKVIYEELTKVLATRRETEQTLAESEHTLAEQRQEVQRAESLLEANTRAYDEAKANYTTLVERNTETELEIQKFSDTCSSLDQAYTEMVTTRDTMYARQTELYRRNITENKLFNAKRAELAELEKVFQNDNDMCRSVEETYRKVVAEHETVQAYTRHLITETETLNARSSARCSEKAELEQKTATMLASITALEREIFDIVTETIEKESILTRLREEKHKALLKREDATDAVARAKYDERVRATLNEKVAAKRRALEDYNELLHKQTAINVTKADKAAGARKRALEEALAARNHIEQNPVRIYILCHNTDRFNKASAIYKKYPWAQPILMKYQDCTFENAVWKQLYEIRDEWYNFKMIGTMSFSGYTKIDLNEVDLIVRDPATWAAGFYHFMRTDIPISNKNHPHLVEIMTDVCRSLEISVPPENFCNYWITSSEKMIQFLIWYEERAYPTVMGHPLIMTDSTYPGSLSKDALMKLCGVPYYPHATFVFERLFLSFFMSLS